MIGNEQDLIGHISIGISISTTFLDKLKLQVAQQNNDSQHAVHHIQIILAKADIQHTLPPLEELLVPLTRLIGRHTLGDFGNAMLLNVAELEDIQSAFIQARKHVVEDQIVAVVW